MGKSITDLSSVTTIGLDLAKHVFQVHGVDASGRVVVAKAIPSGQPGPAAMLTPANRGILPANLKGDERRTGGANYDLPFARKPQIPLAFVPQESNGHDVLKGAPMPAGVTRR